MKCATLSMALFVVALHGVQADEPPALLRTWQASSSGTIFAAAFSPDGQVFATGTAFVTPNAVQLWDVASGELRRKIKTRFSVSSLAFSADGGRLAVGCGSYGAGEVAVHDLTTGKLLWKDDKTCGDAFVSPVIFLEEGKVLAHLSRSRPTAVLFREAATGKIIRQLPAEHGVYSLAASPDGQTLAVGSWDHGFIHLWDLAGDKIVQTLQHPEGRKEGASSIVSSLAFSADGKALVSGLEYRTVRVWDLASGEPSRPFMAAMRFEQAGVSPTDPVFSVGLHLFDLPTGKLRTTLPGVEQSDRGAVAFSPDGTLLVTGGSDGSVSLWRLKD